MPTYPSPAKINLFLAVTGRRADGYHDLVSLVAPLAWGDELEVAPAVDFALTCDDPAVPTGADNLVLKAAQAFRARSRWTGGAHFALRKRIPMGAGLGGGSSNAAAALLALNQMAGAPLAIDALAAVAAGVGSDCPLFLYQRAVVMRGRGERVEPVSAAAAARLSGRRVLLFKPSASVSTPWAYAQLSTPNGGTGSSPSASPYLAPADADKQLSTWISGAAPVEKLLFNSFAAPVFQKFAALPILVANLRRDFGLEAAMSGSGSCCFALLPEKIPPGRVAAAAAAIRDAIGNHAFVHETMLA